MSCLLIRIHNITAPAHLKEADNSIVLELDESVSLRLYKKIEELTDVNKYKVSGSLSFNVKSTPKNDFVLRKKVSLNTIDNQFSYLTASIQIGSRFLEQNQIYVRGYDKGVYDIDIVIGDEHWINSAKELLLKDVDYGPQIQFNKANISLFNDFPNEAYNGSIQGVKFPTVHYGGWLDAEGMIVEDFRPWYHILFLFEKAFCHLGWTFKCPLLESDFGRRWIVYVLDKEFSNVGNVLSSKKTIVRTDENVVISLQTINKNIFFDEIIENTGNSYNVATGKYKAACIADVGVNLKVRNDISGRFELTTKLIYSHPFYGDLEFESKTVNIPTGPNGNQGEVITIEFTSLNVQIDPLAEIYVQLYVNGEVYKNVFFVLMQGSTFTVQQKINILQENDFIDISKSIDKKIKLLDLLKGFIHTIGGKVYTNSLMREVWVYPTYNTKIKDENIDGFFLENITEDLTDKMITDTEKITNPDYNKKRYQILTWDSFDKPTQEFAEKNKLTTGYLSAKIDLGEKFVNEEEELKNPLFQPTVTESFDRFNNYPMIIPSMYDNVDKDKPRQDFGQKPRILYYHGRRKQSQTLQFYKLFGQNASFVWYAQQYPVLPTTPLEPNKIDHAIAYGTEGVTPVDTSYTLYQKFYLRLLFETILNNSVSLLLRVENKDFFRWDFRSLFSFTALGRTVIGRMIEINDFDTCGQITTPVTLVPLRLTDDACFDTPPDTTGSGSICDDNKPELIITKVGNCYNFSIGGTSAVSITTVTYEYKFLSNNVWVTANSLCNPSESFEVRMTVNYSGCPSISRRRIVDACGNAPDFQVIYDAENECFTIIETGTTSESQVVTYLYSIDNGVTWLSYTPPCNPITQSILVKALYEYTNGCADIEIIKPVTIPPVVNDCNQINAGSICDSSGNITRTGNVIGNVALDIIQYRSIGATTWKTWDEMTAITPCPFEYRRVIIYCENECPPYCEDVKVCNCSNAYITCLNKTLTVHNIENTCTIAWTKDGTAFGTGNNISIMMSGTYVATINCSGIISTVTYVFTAPNAGTPISTNPIIVE